MTVNEDGGKYISTLISVPALGIYGSGSASSASVGPFSSAPVHTGGRSISGDFHEKETINVQIGVYEDYLTPTITYQWQICRGEGISDCVLLLGKNKSTHRTARSDGVFDLDLPRPFKIPSEA